MAKEDIFGYASARGKQLIIYREMVKEPVYAAFLDLLGCLSRQEVKPERLLSACQNFFLLLAEKSELYPGEMVGDPWQNYLLDQIILTENVFTRKAALKDRAAIGPALVQAVQQDLRILRMLAGLGQASYQEARARLARTGWEEALPNWAEFTPLTQHRPLGPAEKARQRLKRNLADIQDWDRSGLELLANHYAAYGSGLFGKFWAFRWVRGKEGGYLEGIAFPDPIRLEDLVGYESERAEVVRNTEKFLRGLPASNVLLYGARGTGKSSTVKGLIHAYGEQGLRLIELPKRYLRDYQEILKIIAPQPQKFIIFLDDLSFEEDEIEYKELKGLLEGSLQAKPDNVLVYATSNRRHLVKEYFSDRELGHQDGRTREVRQADTLQEKLSLAERFGLTVIFYSPDQEEYVAIVKELAAKRGINMDEKELRQQALKWALFQNGISGRTAKQFVDYLYSELRLNGGILAK